MKANAETRVRLSLNKITAAMSGTMTFKLLGMNSVAEDVTAIVDFGSTNTVSDLTELRNSINAKTGKTGIHATISNDLESIDVFSPDGYTIGINEFDIVTIGDGQTHPSLSVQALDKDLNVVGAPAVVGDKSSQETRMVITLSDPLDYTGTDDAEIMGETVDLSANTSLEDTIASINTAMAAAGLDVFASNDGSDPANLLLRSLSGADIVVNDGATGGLFDSVADGAGAAVAAAASIHVLSARTEVTEAPPNSFPLSVTSFIANSAPSPICGVNDSIGPVNPRITPIFILEWPPENAVVAISAVAAVAASSFFIFILPKYFI